MQMSFRCDQRFAFSVSHWNNQHATNVAPNRVSVDRSCPHWKKILASLSIIVSPRAENIIHHFFHLTTSALIDEAA